MSTLAKTSVFALVVLMCTACGGRSDARSAKESDEPRLLRLTHGLSSGDVIALQNMRCADGVVRKLGASEQLQLVTFSTVSDCAECDRHLNGLEQLYREHKLPGEALIVTYAPPARQAEIVTAYRVRTSRPICFDETGALWTAHDISHTPVTVLIRNGKVLYLDDAPLETEQEVAQFRHALRSAAGTAR